MLDAIGTGFSSFEHAPFPPLAACSASVFAVPLLAVVTLVKPLFATLIIVMPFPVFAKPALFGDLRLLPLIIAIIDLRLLPLIIAIMPFPMFAIVSLRCFPMFAI